MKRLTPLCAFALMALSTAACTELGMFQDVGTDPHPPTAQLLGIAYQPVEVTDGPTPPPDLQPPDGFPVYPTDASRNVLLLRVEYSDIGADVEGFVVRDLDGSTFTRVVPTEISFFPGTQNTVDLENFAFAPKQLGPHRMEFWAEDSHGSRSEKVTFTLDARP